MTFWDQELDILSSNYQLLMARNLDEFEQALALNPMSLNVFFAGQNQSVKFWHTGKYQNRLDGVDPRLPHKGDGTEEWQGFIDFTDLPHSDNSQQEYFVNWNNKPVAWWNNGDNVPWIGQNHVTSIRDFIAPLSRVTYENLKDIPRQIDDHGTYQQAIELTGSGFIGQNILPPGQSAFTNLAGDVSPHSSDQWPLHLNWQYKDMLFGEPVTNVRENDSTLPSNYQLRQNYPNPFNPATRIEFSIPQNSHVRLDVININGQLVKNLADSEYSAGSHHIMWHGIDQRGRPVASGIYLYRITTGDYAAVKKMVLIE
jgi:hypothetical protein